MLVKRSKQLAICTLLCVLTYCLLMAFVLMLHPNDWFLSIYSSPKDITFIVEMNNSKSNQTIQCNVFKFKYMHLLLNSLQKDYKLKQKWTSQQLDKFHKYPAYSKQFIRLKHFNGSLYWNQRHGAHRIPMHYRNWFLYYFHQLIQQYSTYIPTFDIVIFLSDGRNYKFDYNYFPCFVGEGRQNDHPYLLHSISRSLASQIAFEKHYMEYINNKDNELKWIEKRNMAVFRGSPTNTNRQNIADAVNANNNTQFDVKLFQDSQDKIGNSWMDKNDSMSVKDEMEYKYQIIIDGLGVRDAFARQIRYKSVMLKQESNLREFWYYNLEDKKNVLFWKDAKQLMAMVRNFNDDELYKIAMNGYKFANGYLNVDSINCFMVHMIQIYNEYFFDEFSIEVTQKDWKINKTMLYEIAECEKYKDVPEDELDEYFRICL
eukprot:91937_1